jgi:uncharacterized protein YggE
VLPLSIEVCNFVNLSFKFHDQPFSPMKTIYPLYVVMFLSAFAISSQAQERTLTVIANGSASAPADHVTINLTVSSADQTATGLFVKQDDVVKRLRTALEKGGVPTRDISVQPFRLMPNMEYGQNGTRIIGYRLDTPLELDVDNVKDLPRIIDLATASGASSVNVGTFALGGGKSLHEQAMKNAIANAKKEASAMAKELGKTLGDVVSISETGDEGKAPAAGRGGEEEEERREARAAQQPNTLSEKTELKVVFELK